MLISQLFCETTELGFNIAVLTSCYAVTNSFISYNITSAEGHRLTEGIWERGLRCGHEKPRYAQGRRI